jgi:hypothetical protein
VVPKTVMKAHGNSSKHIVLARLLMASEANHATATSPLERERDCGI